MKAACSSCGTPYSAPSVDSSASDVRVRCENCGNVFDIQGPAQDNAPRTPRGQWYYAAEGDSFGPYTEGELLEKYQTNELDEDTYVWTKGFDEWIPAKEHGAFATALAYAVHQKHQPENHLGGGSRRGNYATPVDALDALPEDPLYHADDTIEYTPDDAAPPGDSEGLDVLSGESGPFDADMFDDTTEESRAKVTRDAKSDAATGETTEKPSDAATGETTEKAGDATTGETTEKSSGAEKKKESRASKKSKRVAKRQTAATKKPRPLPPPLTPDRALRSTTGPKPRRKTIAMAALQPPSGRPAAPPKPQASPTPPGEVGGASELSLAERLRELRDRPASATSSPAPLSTAPTLPPRDGEPVTTQHSAAEHDLPPKTRPKTLQTIRLVALNAPPTDAAKPTVKTSPETDAAGTKPGRPKRSQTVRMVALNAPPTDTDVSAPTQKKPPATFIAEKKPAKAKKGGTTMLGALPADDVETPHEKKADVKPVGQTKEKSAKAKKHGTIMLGGLPPRADEIEKAEEKKADVKPVGQTKEKSAKAKKHGTIMLGALPTPADETKSEPGKHATIDTAPTKDKPRVGKKPAESASTQTTDTSRETRAKSAASASMTSAPSTPTDEKPSRRGIGILLMVLLLGAVAFFGWQFLFPGDDAQPLPVATTAAAEDTAIEEETSQWDEAHAQAQSIFFQAGDAAEAAALEAGIVAQNQRIEAREQASKTIVSALPVAESAAQEAGEKAAEEAEAARRRALAPRRHRAPAPPTPAPRDNSAIRSNEARVPIAPPRPRRQNQNAPARRSNTN